MSEVGDAKFLLDPYLDWAAGEGVPVVEDFAVDLHKVETAPWARFGVDGAIVHLHGHGDFVSLFVFDLAHGGVGAGLVVAGCKRTGTQIQKHR